MRRLLLGLLLLAAPALLEAPAAASEPWPVRPLTIISGFPNGSAIDIYARMLAKPLSRALDVPVEIDNRTGAGGNVASELVTRSRPDGSIVLFGTAATHAINASLYPHFSAKQVAKGATPLTSTPEEMRAQQISDITKWREIIQRSGARAD